MTEHNWKLKEGIDQIDPEDMAKIACALKSLAIYTTLACDHDDDPEDLKTVVDEGLEALERTFDY